MQVSEITLYNILKSKFEEQDAQAIVEGIKQEVKNQVNEHKDTFATKEDLANLKVDLVKTIYTVGLVQYLAILASVIAIIKLIH